MAIINHAKQEINAKIVYFGHEGAGKATSLRYVYGRIKPSLRGELKALSTAGSSLLFFDFTPFEQPLANGYRIRFQIYTLNGPVSNPAAWKMMLKGTDGLVIVAEAAHEKLAVNQDSVMQLRDILNSYGIALDEIPLVLQLNKADQAGGSVFQDEAASFLWLAKADFSLTTATTGDGVLEVLSLLSRKMISQISKLGDLPGAGQDFTAEAAVNDTEDAIPVSELSEHNKSDSDAALLSPNKQNEEADFDPILHDKLSVKVMRDNVCISNGNIRIPLEIYGAGGIAKLTVTVSVEPG